MYNSYRNFEKNIEDVQKLTSVYNYLTENITVPICFDDLLRAQLVNSLSALDKLIHDLIKIGVIEIFNGLRPPTPKYLAEPLKLEVYHELSNSNSGMDANDLLAKASIFEKAITEKLNFVSYQDPSKISDGLSYITSEKFKWKVIAHSLSMNEQTVKTQLKLIVSRRNSIVHEADINPQNLDKIPIVQSDCEDSINFVLKCGEAIYSLVK